MVTPYWGMNGRRVKTLRMTAITNIKGTFEGLSDPVAGDL